MPFLSRHDEKEREKSRETSSWRDVRKLSPREDKTQRNSRQNEEREKDQWISLINSHRFFLASTASAPRDCRYPAGVMNRLEMSVRMSSREKRKETYRWEVSRSKKNELDPYIVLKSVRNRHMKKFTCLSRASCSALHTKSWAFSRSIIRCASID